MAQFELNIYGKDDEILKTYKTDKVRWGVYLEAVKLEESGLSDKSFAEQFSLINGIVKKIFPDLTDDDIMNADADDVMATFKQLTSKGNSIGGTASAGDEKNADGTV